MDLFTGRFLILAIICLVCGLIALGGFRIVGKGTALIHSALESDRVDENLRIILVSNIASGVTIIFGGVFILTVIVFQRAYVVDPVSKLNPLAENINGPTTPTQQMALWSDDHKEHQSIDDYLKQLRDLSEVDQDKEEWKTIWNPYLKASLEELSDSYLFRKEELEGIKKNLNDINVKSDTIEKLIQKHNDNHELFRTLSEKTFNTSPSAIEEAKSTHENAIDENSNGEQDDGTPNE